jgi:hypothetical protein
MATAEDAAVVHGLVRDAAQLLDYCASSDAQLITEDGESIGPPVPGDLRDSYTAAVDQLGLQLQIALATLTGANESFPMSQVLDLLAAAGWDGALRDFKLQVLERSGRAEVTEATADGRSSGRPIRRRVLRTFMGALNAALDSLAGVPGVAAIKELKDFLEKVMGR